MSSPQLPLRVIGAAEPEPPRAALVLPFACLCSDNERLETHGPGDDKMYLSKKYIRAKSQTKQRAKLWWRGVPPLTGDVTVELAFYFADRRKRDAPNYLKNLFDALSKVCYVDDKQIRRLVIEREFGVAPARLEVRVRAYEAAHRAAA